ATAKALSVPRFAHDVRSSKLSTELLLRSTCNWEPEIWNSEPCYAFRIGIDTPSREWERERRFTHSHGGDRYARIPRRARAGVGVRTDRCGGCARRQQGADRRRV